jgi:hypothetical protein
MSPIRQSPYACDLCEQAGFSPRYRRRGHTRRFVNARIDAARGSFLGLALGMLLRRSSTTATCLIIHVARHLCDRDLQQIIQYLKVLQTARAEDQHRRLIESPDCPHTTPKTDHQ